MQPAKNLFNETQRYRKLISRDLGREDPSFQKSPALTAKRMLFIASRFAALGGGKKLDYLPYEVARTFIIEDLIHHSCRQNPRAAGIARKILSPDHNEESNWPLMLEHAEELKAHKEGEKIFERMVKRARDIDKEQKMFQLAHSAERKLAGKDIFDNPILADMFANPNFLSNLDSRTLAYFIKQVRSIINFNKGAEKE